MKISEFLGESYFLSNKVAETLFHQIAQPLPIVDYHNHININDLANNREFNTISQLWISNDPYKHRAMRINGVAEKFISGDASDKDKFIQWAKTMPKTVGNPLFHWSYLELKTVFGIETVLSEATAEAIWNSCNEQLQNKNRTAIPLMEMWNVDSLCTSDNWFDDLGLHHKVSSQAKFNAYPSLRSDNAVNIKLWDQNNFLQQLSEFTSIEIFELADFELALSKQLDHFNQKACKLSDHALDAGFLFVPTTVEKAAILFKNWIVKKELSQNEIVQLESYILTFLGNKYADLGWTMQLHIGAHRYTSSRLRNLAGAAGGYSGIGNTADIASICLFLDELELKGALPDVILFTLNPADNQAFATLTGSFSQDNRPSKIKFGPAWWYNDHFDGIKSNLLSIASYSLLSQCIGMTTDSRSILSFSRHDYFRRILCNIIGEWVHDGLLPNDSDLLKDLITSICYTNSKKMLTNE